MIFTSTCGTGPPAVVSRASMGSSARVCKARGESSVMPKTMDISRIPILSMT